MPGQPTPISRRLLGYMRFSVRGLIVVVLLIGGWLGWVVRSARIQHDAVAGVETCGGHVRYYSETLNGKRWWRRWLLFHLGVNYRDHIENVYSARVWNDAALAHAGRLSGLVRIDAGRSSVTDAGMAHLRGLTNLAVLDLEETRVSDVGLVHLEWLTNLSVLGLRGTRVSDAGLDHLKGLTNLKFLTIGLAWRPDNEPAHLEGPSKLSYLSPNEPQVTAAAIRELEQALPNLAINRD